MYGDKGFDNAWGADLHYNVEPWDVDQIQTRLILMGKTEFGDPNVMNSAADHPGKNFVMFRRTDGKLG